MNVPERRVRDRLGATRELVGYREVDDGLMLN